MKNTIMAVMLACCAPPAYAQVSGQTLLSAEDKTFIERLDNMDRSALERLEADLTASLNTAAEDERQSLDYRLKAVKIRLAENGPSATPRPAPRSPQPDLAAVMEFSSDAAGMEAVFDGTRARPEPFGPLPGVSAGNGFPSLPVEGAAVLPPGRAKIELHANTANYLNRERGAAGAVQQNFEIGTYSIEARKGFKLDDYPAIEAGIKLQGHKKGAGILDGFIGAFERAAGHANAARAGEKALGAVDRVDVNGKTLRNSGGESDIELGDVLLTVKTALLESRPGSMIPTIAARLVGNIPTGSSFSSGFFAGAGLSLSQPLTERLTMHADARLTSSSLGTDPLELPRRTASMGATLGVEYRLLENTSIGAQANWDQSPYQKTGLQYFDAPRTDITIGITQMAEILSRKVLVKIYGREDFNIKSQTGHPFGPYGPADFQAGVQFGVIF